MLNEIEIQNFRCFEETKISGFARVNLIGGKNNSGKTALLEALYLFNAPLPQGILLLRQIRKEFLNFSKAFPEKTWDNLFFQQKTNQKLQINSILKSKIIKNIIINCQKKINDDILFIESEQEKTFSENLINLDRLTSGLLSFKTEYIELEQNQGLEFEDGDLTSDSKGINTMIFSEKKYKQPKEFRLIEGQVKSYIELELYSQNKKQLKSSLEKEIFNLKINVVFLPTNPRTNSRGLAARYDRCVLNHQSSEILNILKIIDPSIEEIRTISIGEPQIYLRRKDEELLPISLFGDALNRIIEIVINLIDVKNGILLIDEIENGIHYLNQREFWLNLFKLAALLDVQIFATTHSLEMIKAFADVGLKDYPEEAAYIELARHPKTHQIIGIKRDMETLNYALEHEKGVGLRGE